MKFMSHKKVISSSVQFKERGISQNQIKNKMNEQKFFSFQRKNCEEKLNVFFFKKTLCSAKKKASQICLKDVPLVPSAGNADALLEPR